MSDYQQKYLKYKNKYIQLKNEINGGRIKKKQGLMVDILKSNPIDELKLSYSNYLNNYRYDEKKYEELKLMYKTEKSNWKEQVLKYNKCIKDHTVTGKLLCQSDPGTTFADYIHKEYLNQKDVYQYGQYWPTIKKELYKHLEALNTAMEKKDIKKYTYYSLHFKEVFDADGYPLYIPYDEFVKSMPFDEYVKTLEKPITPVDYSATK
jgi:hypothetical protein